MPKTKGIILAGGDGTRLWPISRKLLPKQFLKFFSNFTLFQESVLRVKALNTDEIIIFCSEEHRFLVKDQLDEINIDATIILEPCKKNTAPPIAVASLLSHSEDILAVFPSDHFIQNEQLFIASFNNALNSALEENLVVFGVMPHQPHTGYGYIKIDDNANIDAANKVKKFYEKPSLADAKTFLKNGNIYWNSGMFIFKAKTYLEELQLYRQDILSSAVRSISQLSKDLHFLRLDEEHYNSSPSESIDYAVMEQTKKATMVKLQSDWSDLGSWDSVAAVTKSLNFPEYQNSLQINCEELFISSDTNKKIVTLGVSDLVVIDTKDALLLSSMKSINMLKEAVNELNKEQCIITKEHKKVYRPWGYYESVDAGKKYQVKKIVVKPKQRLSIQKHFHRAEHWVVVFGKANVLKGDQWFEVLENESIFIKQEEIHSLENNTEESLEIIEVQTGTYLGEDDIVRFDDKYGRG